jgi:hypothetical protein
MKLIRTDWKPQFLIEISRAEVDTLARYSDTHYDASCARLNQVGGLIFGFRRSMEFYHPSLNQSPAPLSDTIEVRLSWHDVDILCKVVERERGPVYDHLHKLLARECAP